jgi:hypothetical protein
MEISKQESSGLSTNMFKRMEAAEDAVKALKTRVESLNPYRDQVIDEIADHVQKMTVFGKDTVDSFAIYIRQLKDESIESSDHKLLTIAKAYLTDIATNKDSTYNHAAEARKALNLIKGIDT